MTSLGIAPSWRDGDESLSSCSSARSSCTSPSVYRTTVSESSTPLRPHHAKLLVGFDTFDANLVDPAVAGESASSPVKRPFEQSSSDALPESRYLPVDAADSPAVTWHDAHVPIENVHRGELDDVYWPWSCDGGWFPFPNSSWFIPPTHVVVTDVGVIPKTESFYWLTRGRNVWQADWEAYTLQHYLADLDPGGHMKSAELTVAAWQAVPAHLWWIPQGAPWDGQPLSGLTCQPELVLQTHNGTSAPLFACES